LFIDEGTSHLDIATERQVTAAVKALGLTRDYRAPGRDDRYGTALAGAA
jgi:hypothetical protein